MRIVIEAYVDTDSVGPLHVWLLGLVDYPDSDGPKPKLTTEACGATRHFSGLPLTDPDMKALGGTLMRIARKYREQPPKEGT